MRTAVGPVTVHAAGEVVHSETTVGAIGPNVVVVATALPDLAVTMTTAYTGAEDVETIAVDLLLGPRREAAHGSRVLSRDSVPVTHAHEQCLLDHVRQLMIALRARDGRRYAVDVSDDAVELASGI